MSEIRINIVYCLTIKFKEMANSEKKFSVSFQTSNGKVSYEYYSYKDEVVEVIWNGVPQCVAKNGKELKNLINRTQEYNNISRQVEGK